jgi:protein-S-isoprenylcysteine O-methyltransferase Ste14
VERAAQPTAPPNGGPAKPFGNSGVKEGQPSVSCFVGRPQTGIMLKTLSIIGYLGMIGGLLGLVATRAILSVSPLVIATQVASVLLAVWARVTFGRRSFHAAANPTEGGLVTSGPYHFIRHPIYTAICLFAATGVAAHWS